MTTSKKITQTTIYYSLFIIHCSFFIALLSCQRGNKDCIIVTPKIQYDVSIINKTPDMDWWVQNIEGPERDAFVQKMYEAVASGKLKTSDYNTDAQLSIEKTLLILKDNNEIQTTLKRISKLRFLEKWIINKTTSEIYKKVIAICPIILKDTSQIPLFWIKFDTTDNIFKSVANVDKSALISQRIRYDVFINNQNKSNDQRSTINNQPYKDWWVDNIEPSKRTNLLDIIINTALSGKCRLYDYFETPLTSEQLKKDFNHTDTITVPDPKHTGESKDTTIIVQKTFDKNSITKLRFMEEWYFDNKNYNFTKKVVWISPMVPVFDAASNEFRGYKEIFSIYFDKKYPLKTDKN